MKRYAAGLVLSQTCFCMLHFHRSILKFGLGYGGCTAAAIGLAPLVGLTGALPPQRWERIFKGNDIIKSNRQKR